jgi:hypothetical protein
MYEFVDQRTHINIGEDHLNNVESVDYPGHIPGRQAEDAWNIKQFKSVRA